MVAPLKGNDILSMKQQSAINDWQNAFRPLPVFDNDSIKKYTLIY
jgi:hypothetical protein